ncbi:RsmE family RNA methyltransferase [Oleiharenicola lentus]|uniref:RsmE family RNA methyltransferase n=1 Tax=Oleiharenicola lentus TaxID=2508720 RepID=UPI001FEC33F3|nr:RsmE family RNA methyltransferase [Oleiharenicola lentus]
MNIILFHPAEVELPLSGNDARSRHILTVLKRGAGDSFDAGLVNGPRGKATLEAIGADGALHLSFAWGAEPAPLAPIRLLVGLPRPQTARDILREGASLGIEAMEFVRTERGEPSYAQSSLWSSREWETLLTTGAAQAFCTRLPVVRHGHTLAEALAAPAQGARLALDNYEASQPLSRVGLPAGAQVTIAIGSERGWTATERDLLLRRGFLFVHLGERVLRTETACVAAISLLRAKLGLS